MNNKNKTQIFWPQPLWIGNVASNEIKQGESVLIHFNDGHKVKAVLMELDQQVDTITVQHENKSKRTYEFERIKIIKLVKPRQWIRDGTVADKQQVPIEPPKNPQDYQVNFRDGDVLRGKTLGLRLNKENIFLYPLVGEKQFTSIMIPHKSIKGYRVGPLIGEMLVEQNHLKPEQLDEALKDQSAKQELPIGSYLQQAAILTAKDLEQALEHQKKVPAIKFGELLLSQGLITDEQLLIALEEQKGHRSIPLGEILIKNGFITKEIIQQTLSSKLGIPYVDLRRFHPDLGALKLIPEATVRKFHVLPLHKSAEKLIVAVENPLEWTPIEAVRFHTNLHIEPVMATADSIQDLIDNIYLSDESLGDDLFSEIIEYEDEEEETGTEHEENIVIRLVNKIVLEAYNSKASDIHIESSKNKANVRFRKDGLLVHYLHIPSSLSKAVISRIKVMAGMNITEHRKSQDGKIDFRRYKRIPISLRIVTIPTVGDLEDVVIRLLTNEKPIPINQIGLSDYDHTRLLDVIERPNGLFFVCGPTGAGKTTTLHSILNHLNQPEIKLWTAEDPVEIIQEGLRQVQINHKNGMSFADSMRAFLRADPDVIMVGEMRDSESIRIGIEASQTGHMVLSTLHTNGAAESVIRLLDMGMDPFVFTDTLTGVLAQRLTRTLCTHCSESFVADDEMLEHLFDEYRQELPEDETLRTAAIENLKQQYQNGEGEIVLHRAVGCDQCDHTGYHGRIGVHELLIVDDAIRHAIIERQNTLSIEHLAIKAGMHTLKQNGIEKILAGLTDLHQIHRVCSK